MKIHINCLLLIHLLVNRVLHNLIYILDLDLGRLKRGRNSAESSESGSDYAGNSHSGIMLWMQWRYSIILVKNDVLCNM